MSGWGLAFGSGLGDSLGPMKPVEPTFRPVMLWAAALVILAAAGGCASPRENAWLRESERATEMASTQEARRKRVDELTPWERERQEQDARWHEQFRRD